MARYTHKGRKGRQIHAPPGQAGGAVNKRGDRRAGCQIEVHESPDHLTAVPQLGGLRVNQHQIIFHHVPGSHAVTQDADQVHAGLTGSQVMTTIFFSPTNTQLGQVTRYERMSTVTSVQQRLPATSHDSHDAYW